MPLIRTFSKAWDRWSSRRGVAPLLLAVVPVAIVAATLLLWRWMTAVESSQILEMLRLEAVRISAQVEARINSYAEAAARNVGRWRISDRLQREDWEYDVNIELTLASTLDAMEWLTPTLEVRWRVPALDRSSAPTWPENTSASLDALRRARESGARTINGPVELATGEPGFRINVPVMRGTRFDGFVVAYYDLRVLLSTVLEEAGTGYEVSVFDGGREIYRRYPEEQAVMEAWVDSSQIQVDAVSLRLNVWPTSTTLSRSQSGLPRVTLVAGLLLAVVSALVIRLSQVTSLRAQEARLNEVLQQEILARKRAERGLEKRAADLARSNREFEQFAYAISHDLKDPLHAIELNSQLVRTRHAEALDETAMRSLGSISDAVGRLNAMIEGLLEYARVGQRRDEFALTDAEVALRDALANLEVPIRRSDALISHDQLPKVIADRSQLTQLFQNLVGNAIKFRSDRRPEIHIGAQRRGDAWRFDVLDNGIGMDKAEANSVFELFWRPRTASEQPGTGVGLAVCKRIVEVHGGKIWLRSTAGVGSRFYFTIPFDPRST